VDLTRSDDPDKTAPHPHPAARGRRASGLSGIRLEQYDVGEELGRGGMGVVYKGRDRTLDRIVAIKVLNPDLASNADFAGRFIREARAAAKLDHPNIVQVYHAGNDDNALFIAMQFVDARPLSHILDADGRRSVSEALEITRQVADALGAAHAAGIIHRDIKPSNIMIDDAGAVKVMDFGLAKEIGSRAKITRTGNYIGTPEYSSPEQCEAEELDARSDIYSLGVVLYEMLSGSVPFSAGTPLRLFEKIRYERPEPLTKVRPDLPRAVAALVDRMLAKEPEDRYPDCAALVADIDRLNRGESLSVAPRARSRLLPVFVALPALVAAVVVTLLVGGRKGRSDREQDPKPSPAVARVAAPVAPAVAKPVKERHVLIVHDFTNSTGNEDLDWLCIGIADMLITDLAGCDFLDVLSREHARRATKAGTAGGSCDVELKGSFLEAGGEVRIIAQLVDLRAGSVLRAVRAQGTESEVFSILDDVSTQVRAGLEDVLATRLKRPVKLASLPSGIAGRLFASSDRAPRFGVPAPKPPAPIAMRAKAAARPRAPAAPEAAETAEGADAAAARPDPKGRTRRREVLAETKRKAQKQGVGLLADEARKAVDAVEAIEGGAPAGGSAPGALALKADKADRVSEEQARLGGSQTGAVPPEPPTGTRALNRGAAEKAKERAGNALDGAKPYRRAAVKKSAGAPLSRNPRVVAVRARYRALAILESSDRPADLARALELLLAARRAAPGLLGLADEIESLRARLDE